MPRVREGATTTSVAFSSASWHGSGMIDPPPDDFWEVSFVLDPPSPVRFVSAAGGLVVAAGASLHMLRPGSRRLRSRALPPDLEILAVAAEPWSPYRLAISTPTAVGIYTGHRPHEPVWNVALKGPGLGVTHLAWSRRDGQTVLYLRHPTDEVVVVNLDDGSTGTVDNTTAAAIAGDAKGVMAMINFTPVEPANVGDAWVLPVGATEWTLRWVDCGPPDGEWKGNVYLAVHGAALAYSREPFDTITYGGHVEVSWEEENEDGDNSFEMPPGVLRGPIAFQNERVIFAAYNAEGRVNVLRHARNGSFARIARFGLSDEWTGTEATVTGIAWDDERRVLWAASPELGLIKLAEPRVAGAKVSAN
jgi:hypothetical protein